MSLADRPDRPELVKIGARVLRLERERDVRADRFDVSEPGEPAELVMGPAKLVAHRKRTSCRPRTRKTAA